jgi:predicted P-loop ATPase
MGLNQHNHILLEHATYLANAGLIPLLVPGVEMVQRESGWQPVCQCSKGERCTQPGKHPLRGWKMVPMETPAQGISSLTNLMKGARHNDFFNLALRTGIAGKIFGIDIDDKPSGSGFGNWAAFLQANGLDDLMHYETLTAQTGGGGRHYIYKYPVNGDVIQNSSNTAFNFKKNAQNIDKSCIDVRGEGGILIVYPSRHKSGNYYTWLNDPATSIRKETPEAILRAVSEERVSRDPDADYTPKKAELEAMAESLIRKKKSEKLIDIGINLKNVLKGLPIHVDGGAHEPFRDLTYHVALAYPRANPARLMEFFAESIQAREEKIPDGSCTHDDVFTALKGALIKCKEEAQHWENKLVRTDNGKVQGIFGNATLFLRNDLLWSDVFGTNARTDRPSIRRPHPHLGGGQDFADYPRPLIDIDIAHVALKISERYARHFPVSEVRTAVQLLCAQNYFDPFLEYLEKLPPWDGIGRVDTWLSVLGGAEDTPINRAFGAIWLLQVVYRTLEPGCQADHCLILEGGQGVGKSSMLRALVPNPSLFDDGLKPIDHTANKDNNIKLSGPAIMELAELGALRKGDVEIIKAFLTLREDTYRPPFREYPITMQRRCVFVGTTNSEQYLKDPTGNRRFFPVRLGDAKIDIGAVKAHRDQIWAETLLRARRKEPAFLPPELERVAAEIQDSRRAEEPWQEIVENWLDEAADRIRKVTCHDLTSPPPERFGPEIDTQEPEEDPDAIASMFWLEKYDQKEKPELDVEDVRRYGEIGHFSIEDLFEYLDIPPQQRASERDRNGIRNVLRNLGHERVKWGKRDKYRNKWRWLRKTAP